ncbi:MAG: FAD-dependent oxidoreductase [Dehalococcoidales bacterium]|nr:FAD-dependent oxidoreductase [Dehalococcoidales bacterium]
MKLFEPGKIGRLTLKNRIAMAPMTVGGLVEPDGRLSERAIDYFVARAKGGAGMIITPIFRVTREIEQFPNIPYSYNLMIDNNIYLSRVSELADAVHDYGAKLCIQLTAGLGRVIGVGYVRAGQAVGPSVLPCFWDKNYQTRELAIGEIERLIKSFQFAAELLAAAGADAIELHGHEGYLFDEFMTSLWNKRTDKYGGDLNGRLRFPIEVIESIRKGAGQNFPVIFRYGLSHYIEGGRTIEEGLEIARRMENAGADAFDIDAGGYDNWYIAHPPTTMPPGNMVPLAEMVKKTVKAPVMAVGKLGYPDLAESVLQEGKADFIILGRALIADPDWPNKVKQGNIEDICPCIGDHECLRRTAIYRKSIGCAVNAAAGREREFTITPAEKKKSVLVIGGGPAGMEAARVAALRGHRVMLWEKEEVLGGNLIPASVPDFKKDYRSLIEYLKTQVAKLGVTVQTGKKATVTAVRQVKPDVVFIATGTTPIMPRIPGIERNNVCHAIDLLMGKKSVGQNVAVIGGNMVGCEAALYLAQQGKKVTVVEALDSIARDMVMANRMHIEKLFSDNKVDIKTNSCLNEITADGIVIADPAGKNRNLKTDSVVIAVGLQSCDELSAALQDKIPEVYAIGDCVQPRKVVDAIWEGFRKARLI